MLSISPVEEVDAQWRIAAHRKEIEERAANRELARVPTCGTLA